VISGFRLRANEIGAFLGFCASQNGNLLPTFRDNLSVPSSRVKQLYYLRLKNELERMWKKSPSYLRN